MTEQKDERCTTDLVGRLRTVTAMLGLGEKVSLTYEVGLIETAAAEIERLRAKLAEARAEAARMDKAREYFLGERNACLTIIEKLRSALTGIKRAADGHRREKAGERYQYYFHTADAALENRAAAEWMEKNQ